MPLHLAAAPESVRARRVVERHVAPAISVFVGLPVVHFASEPIYEPRIAAARYDGFAQTRQCPPLEDCRVEHGLHRSVRRLVGRLGFLRWLSHHSRLRAHRLSFRPERYLLPFFFVLMEVLLLLLLLLLWLRKQLHWLLS